VTRPNLKTRREIEMAERRVWVQGRWRQCTKMTPPSLIVDYGSTTLVPPGWKIRSDAAGTLILTASSKVRSH
jgi:N-methylhydantoinase A/oxoprolinase/acetone carboxylase beta subunit